MELSTSITSRQGKRQRGKSVDASGSRRVSSNDQIARSFSFSKKRSVRSWSYDYAQTTGSSHRRVAHDRHLSNEPPTQSHIVCAISENLARETCIVSLDIACPIVLNVTKQYNGQNYAETLSCLSVLSPNEILMNEGRMDSPLARKVVQHCKYREGANDPTGGPDDAPASAIVIKFISRAYFDQTKGADLLHKLARKDTYDSKALVQEYILLSSSHAVLHYTQKCLGLAFMNHCMDVRSFLSGGNDENPRVMDIDRSTIIQLELLTSSSGKVQGSFFSAIDCTRTTVGNRLLRSTIMSPPCRLATIHARLELVETFLSNEQLFYNVLKQLQVLSPIDKMLSDIAMIPNDQPKSLNRQGSEVRTLGSANAGAEQQLSNSVFRKNASNARLAQKGIASLVGIKSTLSVIPVIASTLKNHLKSCGLDDDPLESGASVATEKTSLLVGLGVADYESHVSTVLSKRSKNSTGSFKRRQLLLRAIIFALSQPELKEIDHEISEALRGGASYSRNGNTARHQECFALKSSGESFGVMDVIRKAFLKNVDDIYKKADEYAEMYGIYVTVKYGTAKGYYLSLPSSIAADLPEKFIQPTKTGSGTNIHCTTEEIQSLNIRAQDNIQDLLILTHGRIQQLLDVARANYDALARVSDAIALLDLCHGFADKVTLSKESWVPPLMLDPRANSVSDDAESPSIWIKDGRCIVDDAVLGASSSSGMNQMVVNDIHCIPSQTFTVISGVNGSGKSTYLKQVATIVLLAHCGSYIPAKEATITLTTRLCARMGSSDDLENNVSSFLKEMKETAYICKNATSRSLMLLDELGRETSNEDGVAIAWQRKSKKQSQAPSRHVLFKEDSEPGRKWKPELKDLIASIHACVDTAESIECLRSGLKDLRKTLSGTTASDTRHALVEEATVALTNH
ncbi:DNA mismatch repair protein MutS [Nitzschia inconspicua]|uniref:DNA mismatch repair protein MutS n=1 Tax=Nitzschia inconspicua TaxID=303405 RepID=A0A9K3PYF8_9STRA|nr:DNA mismatch repair protein MutS [Nitzschia inconspicua]